MSTLSRPNWFSRAWSITLKVRLALMVLAGVVTFIAWAINAA